MWQTSLYSKKRKTKQKQKAVTATPIFNNHQPDRLPVVT